MSITATRFATHIRTWLLIAALTGLLITVGAAIGGGALYLFVALAVGMNLIGYWFSDKIALRASRARPVRAGEHPELEANRDILISSIAAMVAGAISAVASILQFSMLFGGSDDEDSPLGFIGTLAAIIVAPIAAMLLQLGVSRQREYLADTTGAQLLGRAAPLADALESLEQGARAIPMNLNPAQASLYAINPLPRQGLATLFTTHPPIAERIRRLRALDRDRAVVLAA